MANVYLTQTLKIDPEDYKYKIYIIPKGVCNWAGLADKGCAQNACRVWIEGDHVEVSSRNGTCLWITWTGSKNGVKFLPCTTFTEAKLEMTDPSAQNVIFLH
jgi:hypothetical protein